MQTEAGASLISSQSRPRRSSGTTAPPSRGLGHWADLSGRRQALLLTAAAVVFVADRTTKAWALTNLTPGEPRDLVGSLLRLRLVFNPGAAFSFGTGATPVFTTVMAVVSIGIVLYARRVGSSLWALALGLALGGALGNLTDRLTRPPRFGWGHVVDFFELPNFPVFNIADSAIVTGAVLVAIASFLGIAANGTRLGAPADATEPHEEQDMNPPRPTGHDTGHDTSRDTSHDTGHDTSHDTDLGASRDARGEARDV